MQPDVVTSGCVAEWHAARAHLGISQGHNQGSETQFFDTSGNANHGTLTTFAFTTTSGYAGTGTLADPYRLVFDGASDYVSLPDLSVCEDKTFTFEAWIIYTTVAGDHAIVSEANGPSLSTLHVNAGNLWGRLRDDAGASVQWGGATAVGDGMLHHVVSVCDGSQGRAYCDGAASGGAVALPGGAFTGSVNAIGRRAAFNDIYFPGSIMVVRIYNRALSLAEVQQNYAAGYLWPPDWVRGGPVQSSRHILKIDGFDIPVVA